ncbi:hypothetical protein EWI07_00870 [Sporolactobacillus sp. THM7-4]|nr:hypothetical protein EWI07_00870 [Sporolactobacillus sp. THM7-4]
MKRVLKYLGLFAACFAVQFIWFTYIMPKKDATLLDMLLGSVLFIIILMILDFAPKKRRLK